MTLWPGQRFDCASCGRWVRLDDDAVKPVESSMALVGQVILCRECQ